MRSQKVRRNDASGKEITADAGDIDIVWLIIVIVAIIILALLIWLVIWYNCCRDDEEAIAEKEKEEKEKKEKEEKEKKEKEDMMMMDGMMMDPPAEAMWSDLWEINMVRDSTHYSIKKAIN